MTSSESEPPRRPGEFALIAELFAPLAKDAPGAFGLTDDVAVIAQRSGEDLLLKTDAIVEGVHFFRADPPELIAKKALRRALSDLAAKGADPCAYLLALSLPAWPDMAWLEAFSRGLAEDQAEFSIALIGGDTSATPGPLNIVVTAAGRVPVGAMIQRRGAAVGDLVFVSGTIGDSAGGLALLREDCATLFQPDREALVSRYRLPQPRLALGRALRGVAAAALDVSDGLLADLAHIAEVSKVRVEVDAARIPRSDSLRALWGNGEDAIVRAATGGDDYEIAFTARADRREDVLDAARRAGTRVAEIGRVTAGEGAALLDAQGREIMLTQPGYRHF